MKLRYIAIAAMCGALSVQAQDQLSHEIDVQHGIEVDHYDAPRVSVAPQLQLPAVSFKPLAYSERPVAVAIPNSLTMLEPTAYADTIETSSYNGYAAIGYFPIYNLAASAGYRILDNSHSRMNVWMQFDGNAYKDSRTFADRSQMLRRNTFSAGLSYHLMVGKRSEFDASADYTFARFTAPGVQRLSSSMLALENCLYTQNVNRVNASAQWMSGIEGLSYTAGADYSHFGYQKGLMTAVYGLNADLDAWRPVRENVYRINAAASLPLSDVSAAYLGVDLSVVNNTRQSTLSPISDGTFQYAIQARGGAYNHALISLKPRYRLKNSNLTMTLGALVQFTVNSGKVVHIAPDVQVSWTPAAVFTLWGRAGGGERQNTLASLYDINYMTAPMLAYGNSHVPLTADGGIVAGPFRGAYAELFGGWAKANRWLMPVGYPGAGDAPSMFKAVNISGWHAGAALGYNYRDIVEARVKGEVAQQGYDRGYYLWRDRAKYVIEASITGHPIEGLEVSANYELRACRAMMDASLLLSPGDTRIEYCKLPLGNISMLGVSASYRITPSLTAFVNVDNLLNRQPLNLALLPEQGLRGLVGITYKF